MMARNGPPLMEWENIFGNEEEKFGKWDGLIGGL